MIPSLKGLKMEGVIGNLEFSELEKFFEFQRLIIPLLFAVDSLSFIDPIRTTITIKAMK
jgi:hypothetical protein